jgi:hypothetical protein
MEQRVIADPSERVPSWVRHHERVPWKDLYKPLLPWPVVPPKIIDLLPRRWWAQGNLYQLRLGPAIHLCVGPSGRDRRQVRTIEVGNRIVAWGRGPFDYEASERDGVAYQERQYRKLGITDEDLAGDE